MAKKAISPYRGKKRPELVIELEERDRKESAQKEAYTKMRWVALVIGILLLGAMVAFFWSVGLSHEGPVISEKPEVVPVVLSSNAEPVPLVPKGFSSWTDALQKIDAMEPGRRATVLKAFAEVTGVSYRDIQELALAEAGGRSFDDTLTAGTTSVNTGLGASGYSTNKSYVQKSDRGVLLGFDGEPKVYKTCGNPMRLRPPGHRPKKPGKPGKPGKSAENPYGPPQEPGNPTYGNPPPTPRVTIGYIPGNAEKVADEQSKQPIGGLTPTPSGTPGTGAGGTTPSGSTSGGGSTEVAPAPTTDPDPGIGGETAKGPAPSVD